MATDLPSVPLHPEAEAYYQDSGLLPSPSPLFLNISLTLWVDWARFVGQGLLILVTLVGAYQGVIKLRRDRTTNEIGRRLFGISVETAEAHSVQKLVGIRREFRERVKRRWWQSGEINTERWRMLEGLVNLGIEEAKQHLERALITDIRQPPDSVQHDRGELPRYYATLRERIWKHLENGELDAEQQARLFDLLSDSAKPPSDTVPTQLAPQRPLCRITTTAV